MKVLGDLVVIVETLIKVSLTISVEIMQDRQLIAACQMNLVVHDLEPQWLKHA